MEPGFDPRLDRWIFGGINDKDPWVSNLGCRLCVVYRVVVAVTVLVRD